MSAEVLTMATGVGLSLGFSYIPGLKQWFSKQSPNTKRLVMLASLAVVAGGVFGLACLGRYAAVACTADGAWQMVELFIMAAIANQTAYKLTPTATFTFPSNTTYAGAVASSYDKSPASEWIPTDGVTTGILTQEDTDE